MRNVALDHMVEFLKEMKLNSWRYKRLRRSSCTADFDSCNWRAHFLGDSTQMVSFFRHVVTYSVDKVVSGGTLTVSLDVLRHCIMLPLQDLGNSSF